jgi:hypothetical protein
VDSAGEWYGLLLDPCVNTGVTEMSTVQGMSYKAGLITIPHSSDSKNNDTIKYSLLLEALLTFIVRAFKSVFVPTVRSFPATAL